MESRGGFGSQLEVVEAANLDEAIKKFKCQLASNQWIHKIWVDDKLETLVVYQPWEVLLC